MRARMSETKISHEATGGLDADRLMARRRWMTQGACGFGALAAAALAGQRGARGFAASGFGAFPSGIDAPAEGASGLHLPARAKRVIFLFMQGGVSQVDSFDRKPELERRDGEQAPFDDARALANTGARGGLQRLFKGPWGFRRYGESGLEVSELFPEIGSHADRLCVIRSMHTDGVAHGPATLFLHCGATNAIRPSVGAWVNFGLGTENDDLPGFVSISPSIGNGGARNYGSAFLPSAVQGTAIGAAGSDGTDLTIRHLSDGREASASRRRIELIRQLDREQLGRRGADDELAGAMASLDLAERMRGAAGEVFDLERETPSTLAKYGIDRPETAAYGRRCLLARRLCEAGVRFVQVNYGDNSANPAWDQHSDLPKHATHARAVDRPVAALLSDLAERGLLDDTLVWWGGEFGRTPYAEKNGTGRDHNPNGFTIWLAGGGVRHGMTFGETDEFGYHAIRDRVHMHDLHATILHQLGIDHERLTYRFAGRDYRLTDVYGRVVRGVIDG